MNAAILAILKELTGAPAEFQVIPAGKIDIQGEPPAYCDEASARNVIAAFKARGNDMVIDYEHQTLTDAQAPAAGWIKDLIWKGKDGLWAVVEWTDKARAYLETREYRYFSPVMFLRAKDRMINVLINVALTNTPKINNLRPIVAKLQQTGTITTNNKETIMIEKLKKLLGLADDASEDTITKAVEDALNKVKELESAAVPVAAKEVLDALGAKADAGKEELCRIIASLKAPGDVAVVLSQEVAALKTKITAMEQSDLVSLALKEGKTSPEELEKWGRNLAAANPEQFKLIVLSRPAGSVIPVGGIVIAKDQTPGALDDTQRSVNRMMGVTDEMYKKYNK